MRSCGLALLFSVDTSDKPRFLFCFGFSFFGFLVFGFFLHYKDEMTHPEWDT